MKSIDYEELGEYLPEKARFYAMDSDGAIFFYNKRPKCDNTFWDYIAGRSSINVNTHNEPADWKESLREIHRAQIPDKNTPWGTRVRVRDSLEQAWLSGILLQIWEDKSINYHVIPTGFQSAHFFKYCEIIEEEQK